VDATDRLALLWAQDDETLLAELGAWHLGDALGARPEDFGRLVGWAADGSSATLTSSATRCATNLELSRPGLRLTATPPSRRRPSRTC